MHPSLEQVEQLTRIMKHVPTRVDSITYNINNQCATIDDIYSYNLTVTFIHKNNKEHTIGYLYNQEGNPVEVTYDSRYVQWVEYNGKRVYDGEEYDWNPPNH